jgi:RNA polymerase sigma-70 factor, ECF subfamily
LEACRRYLNWLAMRELDPDFQAKGGASDLVQETFLKAFRGFGQFRGQSEEEFVGWLRRLLLNNLSNFVWRYGRTGKRRVSAEGSVGTGGLEEVAGPTVPDALAEVEQAEEIRAAVAKLPADYRRILHLWQWEGRSFEEIARLSGCSPTNVRAKWFRAVQRLQSELRPPAA